MATPVQLGALSRNALHGAPLVAVFGADDGLRAAGLRSVALLLGDAVVLKPLFADELAAKSWAELESLSPNGLFGAAETFVIDRVAATHRGKLDAWLDILANRDTQPRLVLGFAMAKPDAKLDAALAAHGGATLVAAARPSTSSDVVDALLDRSAARDYPTLIEAAHRAARTHAVVELEAALRVARLAVSGPDEDSAAAETFARLLLGLGGQEATSAAVLKGDDVGALNAFAAEIRTASEMSTLLARLPFALARAAPSAEAKRRGWRDVQKSELAVRRQHPLASALTERALVRIARRQAARR